MNTQFDMTFIRSKKPCYNPAIYLPEGWKGNVKDILRHRDIPASDKLWVVLRKDLLNDKTLRLFAVACARRALTRIPNPDPRSIIACDVAESFANGIATRKELALAAEHAAYAADYGAKHVEHAAYAAAYAVYAADYAAGAATYAAGAATYAERAAAGAAYDAADRAAAAAERQWQVECLLNML